MAGKVIPIKTRIAERSIQRGDCLIWTGAKDRDGYANVTIGHGKSFRLTRILWEQERGLIPPKMLVCHSCDTPSCINIDHLFLGTALDNTRDMIRKGRRVTLRKEAHPGAKLNSSQVEEIRQLRKDGRRLAEIGSIYGICFQQVSLICLGKSWKGDI